MVVQTGFHCLQPALAPALARSLNQTITPNTLLGPKVISHSTTPRPNNNSPHHSPTKILSQSTSPLLYSPILHFLSFSSTTIPTLTLNLPQIFIPIPSIFIFFNRPLPRGVRVLHIRRCKGVVYL